jgi:hypothetical protein
VIVRHVVELSNLDEHGFVADPKLACHCVVRDGKLWDVSGPVDPLTHLNRDFPDHTLGDCVVAESLQPGAKILTDSERPFLFVTTRPGSFARLGHVDIDARRMEWLRIHHQRRDGPRP